MFTTDRRSSHASEPKVPSHVAALAPLVILSVVWTVHLANPDPSAGRKDPSSAPSDGVSVPTEALPDPASYSRPAVLGAGAPQQRAAQVATAASPQGVPSTALAAYQRAETVINAADKTCHADWQLLAAVGRVESDHGRFGGNTLGADGTSRPGIYGPALDGANETQAIKDTDAGQYDRDPVWDRAVGPMQFVPTTWSSVGVDADGDGRRNPQDIDDAALAAAAYLCSGSVDLGSEAGRRSAVLRYNHSQSYADLVLQAREAYLEDGYTAVPSATLPAAGTVPASWGAGAARGETKASKQARNQRGGAGQSGRPSAPQQGSGGGRTGNPGEPPAKPEPSAPEAPEKAPDVPLEPVRKTTDKVVKKVVKKVTEPLPAPVREPVDQVLTLSQAVVRCTAKGVSRLDLGAWNQCIDDLVR